MFKTPAWQRSEGQDKSGGLNAKGRASAKAEGHDLRPPAPTPKTETDKARKKSYCARAQGMKAKLTSSETANDPDSRINKSLRKWKCADGGALEVARKYKDAGGRIYRQNKSPWQRESETTPRSMSPSTQKYLPSDVTPEISKDQYKKGKLGKDDYALARGGSVSPRKTYAGGGSASAPYKVAQFNTDVDALAAMMWSEADIMRGHPDAINAAVSTGWSAKNRALAKFPEGMPESYRKTHDLGSIKDQITNPGMPNKHGHYYGAYSYFNNTRADMAKKAFENNPKLKDYYYDLATRIANGTLEDPTQGSLSYVNPMLASPGWTRSKDWYKTSVDEKAKNGYHQYYGNDTYTPIALAAQKREADILAQRGTPKGSAGDFTPKNPPPVQTPDERSQNAFFQKYLYGTDAPPPEVEGDVDFDTSLLNRMYNELYGRKAPEAEVAYLKDRLGKGEFDMGDLFTYMSKTPEAQKYGDVQLDKMYSEAYGRNASDAEKAYINKALADGTLTRENLAAYLPTTAEGKTYGNAQLDKIYQESFNRKPTDPEREYLNQAIANKAFTRSDLAQYLPTTDEGKTWQAAQAWQKEQQAKADALYAQHYAQYQNAYNTWNQATLKKLYETNGKLPWDWPKSPNPPSREGYTVSTPKYTYTYPENVANNLASQGAGGNVGQGAAGTVVAGSSPVYSGSTPTYSGGSAPPGYTYNPPNAQTITSAGQIPAQYPTNNTYTGGTGSLPIGTGTGSALPSYQPVLPSSSLGSAVTGNPMAGLPSYLSGLPVWQGPSQSASILPSGNGSYGNGSSTYYGTGGSGSGGGGSGSWQAGSTPGLGVITITRNSGGRVGRNAGGALNDAMGVAKVYKKGGPVWSKPRPKSLGKPTPLSSDQKSSAKASAKAAGRPYPNLVDNMRAAKKS